MVKARMATRLLGGLLAWGGAGTAWAAPQPSVAELINFAKPKQENVVISTPTEAEYPACKVELVKGPDRASGWLLRDPRGQPLRRFYDSNGDNQIDVYSYYLDGQEVYREVDSNYNGRIDQFRWLNAGGSRWGVDLREEGRISAWKAISAEETSQEILAAVLTNNFPRLQALMLTEAEIKALDLPEPEANRLRESVAATPAKFKALTAKLGPLDPKSTQWLHLETSSPQCVPADALGGKYDLVKYRNGTILYQKGDKHDFLQTGELIQVGRAWRIVTAPSEGAADAPMVASGGPSDGVKIDVPDEVKPLLEELKRVDTAAPQNGSGPEVARYNLARAQVLERIVALVSGEARTSWVKQVADCYSAAAQNAPAGDRVAYGRLLTLRDDLARTAPGSALTAYVAFREMSAEYAGKLAAPNPNMQQIQEGWAGKLRKFVEDFPAAEDTPDALLQLGMVSEFIGKETEAKNFYGLLTRNFPQHALAAKAQGALTRLELDGKPLALSATTLSGQGFNLAQLQGKVVVVYYWASWNQQCAADFAKLKAALATYGPKGVELVTVNLDNSAAEASSFLARNPGTPGVHLFQAPGGLDSPLATQYGVMVLPNLFLVDKTGKVASRTVQIGNLEDELKKLAN
jgi:thiol-disulfide isomerase/thioredoxin